MQLMLNFVQQPSIETEPSLKVWPTLQDAQRHESLAVLARLIAKTAAAKAASDSNKKRRGPRDD